METVIWRNYIGDIGVTQSFELYLLAKQMIFFIYGAHSILDQSKVPIISSLFFSLIL